jgi:hypothetical protein
LGIADVRGWLETLEAGALDEWIAYYHLEPWDRPTVISSAPTHGGAKMMSMKEAADRLNNGGY